MGGRVGSDTAHETTAERGPAPPPGNRRQVRSQLQPAAVRPVKHRPLSHDAWLLDSFLQSGHTPDESIAYLADYADFEDEQLRQRSSPAWMISPVAGGWRGRLRGLFGSE